MSTLAQAEAYRDQLHDLPDGYTEAQERLIDATAVELATRAFDKMDKESLLAEWVEAHADDYRDAAIDELGLA